MQINQNHVVTAEHAALVYVLDKLDFQLGQVYEVPHTGKATPKGACQHLRKLMLLRYNIIVGVITMPHATIMIIKGVE